MTAVAETPAPEGALSAELEAALDAVYQVVHEAGSKVLLSPNAKDAALEYLVLLHQIIRASVPLMRFSLAQISARTLLRVDKELPIIDYLKKHIAEEMDHDKWLLDDLEASGCPRENVVTLLPSRRIAHLVGSQYYLIAHHDPIAILGYIALLESAPPSKALVDGIQARSGLPAGAFRTLRTHTEVDPHHMNDLDVLLNRVILSREEKRNLLTNAVQSGFELSACVTSLAPDKAAPLRRTDAFN